jgi:hypothetical protein
VRAAAQRAAHAPLRLRHPCGTPSSAPPSLPPSLLRAEVERNSKLAVEWLSTGTDCLWVKTALTVMKKLKSVRNASKWFGQPVPASVLDPAVTNYSSIIAHLEDLGSIETRLRAGGFASPDAWVAAVRTVFRNAYAFNSRINRVTGQVDEVSCQILDAAEGASKLFEIEMMRLRGVVMLS